MTQLVANSSCFTSACPAAGAACGRTCAPGCLNAPRVRQGPNSFPSRRTPACRARSNRARGQSSRGAASPVPGGPGGARGEARPRAPALQGAGGPGRPPGGAGRCVPPLLPAPVPRAAARCGSRSPPPSRGAAGSGGGARPAPPRRASPRTPPVPPGSPSGELAGSTGSPLSRPGPLSRQHRPTGGPWRPRPAARPGPGEARRGWPGPALPCPAPPRPRAGTRPRCCRLLREK